MGAGTGAAEATCEQSAVRSLPQLEAGGPTGNTAAALWSSACWRSPFSRLLSLAQKASGCVHSPLPCPLLSDSHQDWDSAAAHARTRQRLRPEHTAACRGLAGPPPMTACGPSGRLSLTGSALASGGLMCPPAGSSHVLPCVEPSASPAS